MSAYNLRRIAPEVGATLAVAPMPPRLAAPPAPSALPGLAWPASAAAPVANFLSEAEQIRMGLGLLSAVWFAFFAVAESRLTNVEQQAEVAYLVASASLGFAWTGPLTVLAGMRMYPRTYLLWQPFVGGYSFVLLQAFGWLLYSATLMFCLLALANLGSSGHGRALSEGSLLVLGVLGVAAGVLLNFSLDSFDEAMCTRPAPATKPPAAGAAAETPAPVARPRGAPRVGVLATGKTLVAALLSAFGLCLFLICDQYRARLPFGSLPIASLSFVGAAVVTQCVNGPTVLPGYRAFQPFEGGMSFVILQASSWLALGGVLQAVLLVPSDRISELSGVLPTMGLSGLGSQLILLSSLLHYEPCAPRPAGAVAAARSRRLRALASSEAFLSLCFYVWAAVSFVCGYALERGVLVRWPIPMDMRSLWMLSLLLLAIATPCAHFAGERLHCGYRAWQPFRGGTMFCVAQGFGWMLYGVFYLSLLVHARRARVRGETYSTSDVVVFAFGSLAYAMVAFSLDQFDTSAETEAEADAELEAEVERSSAPVQGALSLSDEVRASLAMSTVAVTICAVLDWALSAEGTRACVALSSQLSASADPDDLAAMYSLLLGSASALFALAAALAHVGASRRLRNYRLWMPFQGGDSFVVRQALGWTLFAVSQAVLWMLVLTRIELLTLRGLLFGAGAVGALAHALLLRSLHFFENERVDVRLTGLADSTLTVARLGSEIELLQRLLGAADQPLVARVLSSVLAQLEERAAAASVPHAQPFHVQLSARALQLVNLCLILVSACSTFVADALRATQPQIAQVLLAVGAGLAVYTSAFSHAFLGRLFHPSYRTFQPFVGSRDYVLLQAVGWTLLGTSLVAALTILYAQVEAVALDGAVATVGVGLFLAQLLLAISLFAYRPPEPAAAAEAGGDAARVPVAEWSVRVAGIGRLQATHGQAIAVVMSLVALVLFMIADLAPARLGANGVIIGVPTAPIVACALVALCGSVGVTYLISCTQMPCRVDIHDAPQQPQQEAAEAEAAAEAAADGGNLGDGGHAHSAAVPQAADASQDGTLATSDAGASAGAAGGEAAEAAEVTEVTEVDEVGAALARALPRSEPRSELSVSSADVTVVFAGGGRFLVPHIFGCAILSLTFLRAALVELHRFEKQASGQNTLTGLAGLAAIALMLCSQGTASAEPRGSERKARSSADMLIHLDTLPAQLLCSLGGGLGGARFDRRALCRIARAFCWRLLNLGLAPLTAAAALAAALATRDFEPTADGAPRALPGAAELASRLVGGAVGGAHASGDGVGGGARASAALLLRLARGNGTEPSAWPLALAAARASPPSASLYQTATWLARATARLLNALSPGKAFVLGMALSAAALVARLALATAQDAARAPAARRAAALAAPRRGRAADGAAALRRRRARSASEIDPTPRSSLEHALAKSAGSLAHGIARLRAHTSAEHLAARALALLRGVDAAPRAAAAAAAAEGPAAASARADAAGWPSAGAEATAADAAAWPCTEATADAALPDAADARCGARPSPLEMLVRCSLADTLGAHLPAAGLIELSRCSRQLRALLTPASFWRMRFVMEHGATLGLVPHRIVLPTLCVCAAQHAPPSLLATVRAALARWRSEPAADARERLGWRRACALADAGVALRYCVLCSRLDVDGDVAPEGHPDSADGEQSAQDSAPRAPPLTTAAVARSAAAAAAAACYSAWVELPDCCARPGARATAHRRCLEAAAARGGGSERVFACPSCARPLAAAERPVCGWGELLAALESEHARQYARRALLVVAAALVALWGLGTVDRLSALAAGARGGRVHDGPLAMRTVAWAVLHAMPSARAACFGAHVGCLIELLASRYAWRSIEGRGSSSHWSRAAVAASLFAFAVVEFAANSTLRLSSLHPVFALSLPSLLARPLSALCSLLFYAGAQAVLLRAWAERSTVPTPHCAEARAAAVLVSGVFGEGNKGLHSFVRELAASGAPRLQPKLGLDPGSAAARIRRVAYERNGLAIARGHAQQLLARLGCVDVCRAYRN